MNEMEKAILDIIEKRYKRKYVGGIKVTKLGRTWTGYKLTLNLGNPDVKTIQISADLEAEDFLKFIEQELINRQLINVQWFKGVQPDYEQRGTCFKDGQSDK